ncbi:5-amino-6-(D-ribitylamino)uracil--L-tyrosine 4-hydroxyphenyl transferase CofH [bacterium]|nr:5-amino-6-(D-ribitylamino)uracil--L-tyrosine 4-hydroxyphenyl transferase CofH [bacterium]|tara:strand:- start:2676 stop:3863 length:1188 start_codon:yes stop_codon:yes gene_type:complete
MDKELQNIINLIENNRAKGFETTLSKSSSEISKIIEKPFNNKEITEQEAEKLFLIDNTTDLSSLVIAADIARKEDVGDDVTFVVNRNINFTNICNTYCGFCNFMAAEGDERAYFLTMDEIKEKVHEAKDNGATEVCMQGGMHPDIDGNFYVEIIKSVKEAVPEMHTHCFSPFEVHYGASTLNISIRDFVSMLKDVGHGTFPGTAAEILSEDVRKIIAPGKITTDQWVDTIKEIHKAGMKTTSTIMYGHVDKPFHWARHFEVIRQIQKETNGITEFVPLRFIPWDTRLFKKGISREGPTDLDQLKMYAVSRLFFRGIINNIQVSWVKQGPEFAQYCLTAGANDFGGTLMEEKITTAAGGKYGQYFPPEEFRRLTLEINRRPVERSTSYEYLKVFEN